MTIASTNNRNDYTGSGAVSVYPYTFRIFAKTDLKVIKRQVSNGTETVLTVDTDYTVDGVKAVGGGNVTLVAGSLASGYTLTIRRVRPLLQSTDIRNQGDYFAEIHEDSFDHAIMVTQQHQDSIDRSVKLPDSVAAAAFDPTLPATVGLYPGSAIIVNSAGNGLSLGATTTDVARIMGYDTYPNLKAAAAAQPLLTRMGWATDIKQFVFYTADKTVGQDLDGWIVLGG